MSINLLLEHFVTNIYLQEPRTVQTFAAVETAEPSSAVVELSVEPLCLSAVSVWVHIHTLKLLSLLFSQLKKKYFIKFMENLVNFFRGNICQKLFIGVGPTDLDCVSLELNLLSPVSAGVGKQEISLSEILLFLHG